MLFPKKEKANSDLQNSHVIRRIKFPSSKEGWTAFDYVNYNLNLNMPAGVLCNNATNME